MRLEQLNHIIVVEQNQSVSKAARQLYIAQPSLSTSIRALEQELNVQIFKRSSAGTVPTSQGREILSLAKAALDSIERMKNFSCSSDEMTGDVHLLITPAYSFLIYDLLVRFKARFPHANIIITEKNKMDLIEEISQGLYNLGITAWGLLPGVETEAALCAKHIQHEDFAARGLLIYVSADHWLADRQSVSWAELQGEKFALYGHGICELLANFNLQVPDQTLVMSDRESLKKVIARNYAISVMPDNYALGDVYVEQGLIKVLSIEGLNCHGVDCLVFSDKRKLSYLEEQLLCILRDFLKNY